MQPRLTNPQQHGFHIISKQTSPALFSAVLIGFAPIWFYNYSPFLVSSGGYFVNGGYSVAYVSMVAYALILWFYSLIRDSIAGRHTSEVQAGLLLGFLLFLVSEVFFFVSVFWTLFFYNLSPLEATGYVNAPVGFVNIINAAGLPLFNTCLLIVSGIFLTLSHQALLLGKRQYSFAGLLTTIVLGVQFSYCQWFEYKELALTIVDGVYASMFFFFNGVSWFACGYRYPFAVSSASRVV